MAGPGAAAETQLPHGLVLDGELVVWHAQASRLSFEALQRRAATRARGAVGLAAKVALACFLAFDLLQQNGQELLARPYAERPAPDWCARPRGCDGGRTAR
ncbi:hypothetical protein [Streptomyces sp. NRRL F-2580]|uniref:ATP-dependent DNA ligase n=1 Tax=Streptomyces sp. NRRL F-2580 TaxID=1463841 RepID=UPI0004C7D1E4|nr:hypothetical protein [Streptomyces sp. NRRL F-2580]